MQCKRVTVLFAIKMSGGSTSFRFKNKVAIVTGGADGIGRACIEVFAENGGKAIALDIKDDLGSKMKSSGPGEIIYMHCDMTKEEEIKKSIEEIAGRFGRLDCLVNNVGRHSGFHCIDDLTVQSFRDLLEVNLISHFAASKYALPFLRKTQGCIVNISSICGSATMASSPTYCATKGGVTSLTKALAIDEAKYGVRVNSIAPSTVATPLFKNLVPDDEKIKFAEYTQLNRIAEPREIALACLFLAVDATFTTGEELMCTGGSEIGYGVKK